MKKGAVIVTILVIIGLPVLVWGAIRVGYEVDKIIEVEQAKEERIANMPEGSMVTISATRTPVLTPTAEPALPRLTVAFEASTSHLPVIQVAELEDKEYSVELLPLYFNGEAEYSADELASMLKSGEVDILFTGSQFLPRFGNIGKIIFPIDQSVGTDQIVSWTQPLPPSVTIATVANSRGHFLALEYLRFNEVAIGSVEFVFTETDEEAVQSFLVKEVDAVAGRGRPIERAILVGGETIASSSDYPIYDLAIASNMALSQTAPAIEQFIYDWYEVLKMLQEDPETVAQTIAYWRYDQQPTNGWTRIYRDTAMEDLQQSFVLLAQANLEGGTIVMQDLTPLRDLLQDSYGLWIWSGITPPEFDAESAIETSFVLTATERTELWPADESTLVNDSFRLSPILK